MFLRDTYILYFILSNLFFYFTCHVSVYFVVNTV